MKGEIVLVTFTQLDSEDPTSEEEELWVVRYPPKAKRNQVVVTMTDYDRLEPGEFLNDSLIDFYLRLLINEKVRTSQAFVFSSFFYSKLKAEGHSAVRNWTKSIDIFDYHHILVPIAEDEHWTLLVLMQAHTLMTQKQKSAWLYFDSLGGCGQDALDVLRSYICSEWHAKRESELDMSDEAVPLLQPNVPLQSNLTDCGVYLLHYSELFLMNPRGFDIKQPESVSPRQFFKPHWFQTEDIAKKRLEIKAALLQLNCGGVYRVGVNVVFKKSWFKRRIRKFPKRYLA
jgi:sentrin-specific protease 7